MKTKEPLTHAERRLLEKIAVAGRVAGEPWRVAAHYRGVKRNRDYRECVEAFCNDSPIALSETA